MAWEMEPLDFYDIPDSPYRKEILIVIAAIYNDAKDSACDDTMRLVEDALYLAVKARMSMRIYDGDDAAYVNGLIQDIADAQFEHSQIAYSSAITSQAFSELKMTLVGLLVTLTK